MRFPKFTTIAAASLAISGLAVFASTPAAFAQDVPVNAHVNGTISMTGLPAAISLTGDPGQQATTAVNYTVTTNSPLGFNVFVTPKAAGLQGSTTSIPNSALSVNGDAFTNLNAKTVQTKNAPGAYALTDNWALTIPANQAAGDYTGTFTYEAIGK